MLSLLCKNGVNWITRLSWQSLSGCPSQRGLLLLLPVKHIVAQWGRDSRGLPSTQQQILLLQYGQKALGSTNVTRMFASSPALAMVSFRICLSLRAFEGGVGGTGGVGGVVDSSKFKGTPMKVNCARAIPAIGLPSLNPAGVTPPVRENVPPERRCGVGEA